MRAIHSTLAASLPLQDWQFWVVTAAAIAALAFLLRAPISRLLRRNKGKSVRTSLTVGGKSVDKK
jgi:predicted RNA-binding Zn ribbon-like protein